MPTERLPRKGGPEERRKMARDSRVTAGTACQGRRDEHQPPPCPSHCGGSSASVSRVSSASATANLGQIQAVFVDVLAVLDEPVLEPLLQIHAALPRPRNPLDGVYLFGTGCSGCGARYAAFEPPAGASTPALNRRGATRSRTGCGAPSQLADTTARAAATKLGYLPQTVDIERDLPDSRGRAHARQGGRLSGTSKVEVVGASTLIGLKSGASDGAIGALLKTLARSPMPALQSAVLPKTLLAKGRAKSSLHVAKALVDAAVADAAAVYAQLETRPEGLTQDEADARLTEHGPNVLAKDQRPGPLRLLWSSVRNPLVALLAVLAAVSFATRDPRAGTMMLCMIALSVGLKLFQETKANDAAAQLRAMISVTASAMRGGVARDVAVSHLVPGDVVQLAAGDMVPADVRIVHAKDLFVVQGSLTGESFPVEKFAASPPSMAPPLELRSVAFLGTSVLSGAASAVVVATGKDTYLGGMAEALQEPTEPTAFDRGVSRFTLLILVFMAVMVPLVFLINGLTRGDWTEAFFFAVAVAVGLTPEMLPMVVTICLSKGAVAMGKKQVIVKRINAIQSLGAMDVLCTDKTGTLTRDEIVLERHCDVKLREREEVLALAYVNSHFQTGLKSVLDRAVLAHDESHAHARVGQLTKVDEIPFDFERRIMSVVVRLPDGHDQLVAKGAPEAIFERCVDFRLDEQLVAMDHPHVDELRKEYERLSADGYRVLAIATKLSEARDGSAPHGTPYGKADEGALTLEGYVAFLDPPKESALAAIQALEGHGVAVKVITGDNELVARYVCGQVGLAVDHVLLGEAIEKMTEPELAEAAERTVLFARVSPGHKQRIVVALRSRGHTVGFMGDGINDAPALHAADVGISVDTAVDIAREAADLILLEKSLLVLDEGVLEGRKVFSNIVKYVRMGASSNFGNTFSVLGASLFVPFLPMRPIQILANNLLYDIGQTAIPTDAVDADRILKPRDWEIKELTRFILLIGPCSSIFDYTTFLVMLYVFDCWNVSTPAVAAHSQSLFQTGWFVESLLTQTLIIHVIRTNKIPFLQSRPSNFLMLTSLAIVAVGVALPFTPVGDYLGFTRLPALYWLFLAPTLLCYLLLTQTLKSWLFRHRWI